MKPMPQIGYLQLGCTPHSLCSGRQRNIVDVGPILSNTTLTVNNIAESTSNQPFETGQIWKMGESSLQIRMVGKNLVHYQHYHGRAKRPPILLSGKAALDLYLQEHDAILSQDSA